jgi:hypothetical protein
LLPSLGKYVYGDLSLSKAVCLWGMHDISVSVFVGFNEKPQHISLWTLGEQL